MIKIENITTCGWESAFRGMRAPLQSWAKSDSFFYPDGTFSLGEADLNLAKRLVKAGDDHAKFLRMIHISMDVIAPLYWWKEADQYKISTTTNSTSTMHRLTNKPFTEKDFSFEHLIGYPVKYFFDVEENFEEIFKEVPEHPLYTISNKGRVFSKISNKFLTPCVNSSGYKKVVLNGKNLYVHRIVASVFCENPKELQDVNHKDGNKWNNNFTNLEWVTKCENSQHAYHAGLHKIDGYTRYKVSKSSRRFSDSEVEAIHNKFNDGMTKQEIADEIGCGSNIICNLLNGNTYKEIEMSPYDAAKLLLDNLNALREQYLITKDKEIWWQIIQLLPSSYNQTRTWDMSLATLINICHARENHKLDEWRVFVSTMLEKIPYLKDFYEVTIDNK